MSSEPATFGHVTCLGRGRQTRAAAQAWESAVAARPGNALGPVDFQGVAQALHDPAARKEVVQTMVPAGYWKPGEQLLASLFSLKDAEVFTSVFWRCIPDSLPTLLPSCISTACRVTFGSISKAGSGSLPAIMPVLLRLAHTPVCSSSTGRLVRVDLPKPSKISHLAVGSYARACLLRMLE